MGFKFKNPFGHRDVEKSAEPSSNKQYNSSSSAYYDRKIKSIRGDLDRLRELSPEIYKKYMAKLYSITNPSKSEGKIDPLSNINTFNQLIEEVSSWRIIAERSLINSEINSTIDDIEMFFNDPSKMITVDDITLEVVASIINDYLAAEKKLRLREGQMSDMFPEGREILNEHRLNYIRLLLKLDYRVSMLKVLNDVLNHSDEPLDNSFTCDKDRKEDYIGFLLDDISNLSTRFKPYKESFIRSDQSTDVLMEYMEKLEKMRKDFCLVENESQHKMIYYPEENSQRYFFDLATQFVKACISLNKIEYCTILDQLDEDVRAAADERIHTEDVEYAQKLNKIDSPKEAFNYQISHAWKRGLVGNHNWIKVMLVQSCKSHAVVSLIEQARETQADIVVFPSTEEDNCNQYRVYTQGEKFTTPQSIFGFKLCTMNSNNLSYCGKIPNFLINTFNIGMLSSDVHYYDRALYSYDKETGIYNIFITKPNPNQRIYRDNLKSACERECLKTKHLLLEKVADEKFDTHIYKGVTLSPTDDLLPILGDLKKASVRYFIDYDENKEKAVLFFDPSREESVKQFIGEHRTIDDVEWFPQEPSGGIRFDDDSRKNLLMKGIERDDEPDEISVEQYWEIRND